MNKPTVFALLLLATISLGACGQKGPLYLPKEDHTPPATEAQEDMPEDAVTGE